MPTFSTQLVTTASLPVAHVDISKYLETYRLAQVQADMTIVLRKLYVALKFQWFLSLVYIVGIT